MTNYNKKNYITKTTRDHYTSDHSHRLQKKGAAEIVTAYNDVAVTKQWAGTKDVPEQKIHPAMQKLSEKKRIRKEKNQKRKEMPKF